MSITNLEGLHTHLTFIMKKIRGKDDLNNLLGQKESKNIPFLLQ